MVLMSQDDLRYLPRKNYLILGRIRTKNTQKREKVLKHIKSSSTIESTDENLVLCSADSNKQNDFIEFENYDLSNAQYTSSEISESTDQMSQQQTNFHNISEGNRELNQENESKKMDSQDSVSDKNRIELNTENKQTSGIVVRVTRKGRHFVKGSPE